jgi:hypothetical protein
MISTSLQKNTFFLTSQKALNQSNFFLQQQVEIPELGIILFGLDSTLPQHIHQKVFLLLKDLGDNYFIKQDLTDPVGSFEKMLSEFNKEFDMSFPESFAWTKKLNITVALFLDNNIHFSNYGNNYLLLLRQKNYVDLIRYMSAHLHVSTKKIFDQFYSGSVKKYQRITLCNQATFDYFNTDNLKYIFNLLPISNIESQLEQLAQDTTRNQHISGIIIQLPNYNKQVNNLNQTVTIPNSDPLKHLVERTTATQKILRPQIFPDFIKIKSFIYRLVPHKKNQLLYPTDRKGFFAFKRYFPRLKDTPANIKNLILRTKHKKNDILIALKNLPSNSHFSAKLFKDKISSLPTISKLLLSIALLLLITLAVNISLLGIKHSTTVNSEYFDQTISQISGLHSDAQAAIIYNDNLKARNLLKEAQNLIYNLPKNNTERQNINSKLLEKNQELISEANKITIINSPITLLTLDKLQTENIIAGNLQLLADNLYMLANNKLVRINTTNREINEIPLPFTNPKLFIKEEEKLLILNDKKELYRFTPTNNSLEQINIPLENTNLTSGQIYNGNLYGINQDNNQIVRFNKSASGFGTPQNWLTQSPTEKLMAITIDGSIYTSIKNQGVIQYIRGKQSNIIFETVEPNLIESKTIITTNELNNIYILDSQNKRLLIFNKEGVLLRQYYFPEIENISGLVVNTVQSEGKRLIYLINDQAIYEISIAE